MSPSSRDRVFTLWDLAEAVNEEADLAFDGDQVAGRAADLVLLHLIRTRVRNVCLVGEPGDGVPRPPRGKGP
jgi:hypothetical protein